MGKALVIVESPAKAKTINKYLGSGFVVKSSVGHIRDLPTSGSLAKKTAEAGKAKTAKSGKKDEKAALVNRMVSIHGTTGKPTTRFYRVKKKSFLNYKPWQRMLTIFISQRIWTAKERRLPGTCVRSSVETIRASAALCLTRSLRMRSVRPLKSRVN